MKIITAIGDPYLNDELKKYENLDVLCRDIQYQDGIIEIMLERKEIDLLIISDLLIGKHDFKTLISKILEIKKDLKIIVFLKEKNDDIEQFLNVKKIYKIYNFSQEDYICFFESFNKNEQKNNLEINNEISELKAIILKNNSKIKEKYKKSKLLIFDGESGVGKTCLAVLFSKYLSSQNKKVLIIELENSIENILKIKKEENNVKNILKNIQPVEKQLYLLSDFSIILNKLNSLNVYEIEKMMEKIRNEFEYIILDFSKNTFIKYEKYLLKNSEDIIFIIEGDFLSLSKSLKTLEVYEKDFKISKNKIKIIINKLNRYSLKKVELEEYFYDYFCILNVYYNDIFTRIINNNFKRTDDIDELKNVFENILKEECYERFEFR